MFLVLAVCCPGIGVVFSGSMFYSIKKAGISLKEKIPASE
jgi:hypothetical protein